MTLLDTDHVSVLFFREHSQHVSLRERIEAAPEEQFASTIITLEEHLRGWLAYINRHHELSQQVFGYDRLADLYEFYRSWLLVRFDREAAEKFSELRKQKVRIGTKDLRIAAIALVHDALLLSANLSDFRQVPGLRVENWLAR